MKSGKMFKEGMHCGICDCTLLPPQKNSNSSFTVDHVYPKSKDTNHVRVQALCKRCNSLKSNHIPTVTLIRLLRSVRITENLCGVNCSSIECKIANESSVDRIYVLKYRGLGSVSFHGNGVWVTAFDKGCNEEKIKNLNSISSMLKKYYYIT